MFNVKLLYFEIFSTVLRWYIKFGVYRKKWQKVKLNFQPKLSMEIQIASYNFKNVRCDYGDAFLWN